MAVYNIDGEYVGDVYIGSGTMPDGTLLHIDPEEDADDVTTVPSYIVAELDRVTNEVYEEWQEGANVFIMCADPHYSSYLTGYVDYTIPALMLLADKLSPDAVCILGDEITGAVKKATALNQLGIINTAFRGLNVPRIRAVGNHDYNTGYDDADSQKLTKGILEHHFNDNSYFDFGNTRLICVQSVLPNYPASWGFDDDTLQFVEDTLASASGKTCVCISHVPAYRDGDGLTWTPSKQEEMSDIVEDFIAKGGKFGGWYCGHAHYERFGIPEGKKWHMNFLATAQEKNITPNAETCDNGAVGYTNRLNKDKNRILFYVVVVTDMKVKIHNVGSGSDYAFQIPVEDVTLLSSLEIGSTVKLPRVDGSTTDYLLVGVDDVGQSILLDTSSRGSTAFGSGESGSLDSIKYIGSVAESKASSVKALYPSELFGSVTFEHDCAGAYTEEITSGYFPVSLNGKKVTIGDKVYADITDNHVLYNISGGTVNYWTLGNKLVDGLYKSHCVKGDGTEIYTTNLSTSYAVFRGLAIIKAGAKVDSNNKIYL